VDVAKMKMEFLQHYYDANGVSMRTWMIANFRMLTGMAAIAPGIYNWLVKGDLSGRLIKRFSGFAEKRSMPTLERKTLRSWLKQNPQTVTQSRKVYLFCDEFTNYNDTHVGIKAVNLLRRLGYEVIPVDHPESARALLSKGFLRKAKVIAEKNVKLFSNLISEETPLVGIEPSAILGFRDEYPDLVSDSLRDTAKQLAKNVYMVDEFLSIEADLGNIRSDMFKAADRNIKLHGHCQQKALSSVLHSKKILSLPQGYSVEVIPSGCCGMAGSFGYEKEHYDVSMKIGELVLFPAVRNAAEGTLIAAPGTSCRHQIKDGTGAKAQHPVEILYDALV
jgi:Fe-S oxidoreductase